MDLATLQQGLILYIILAASIALHEYGHAKVADLLGDPLPRAQGRVTLNPLAHMDPIGTVLIPLVMILLSPGFALIGWGKPVQISLPNPRTRVRDEILTTIAGPGMNLVIMIGATISGAIMLRVSVDAGENVFPLLKNIMLINATLIAFNLIPLPPLDGSRIMRHVVGISEENFYRLAANSWWVLLILINIPVFRDLIWKGAVNIAIPFLNLMVSLGGLTTH